MGKGVTSWGRTAASRFGNVAAFRGMGFVWTSAWFPIGSRDREAQPNLERGCRIGNVPSTDPVDFLQRIAQFLLAVV